MLTKFRASLLDRLVLRPTRTPITQHCQKRSVVQLGKSSIEFYIQKNFNVGKNPDLLILKFPGTAGRAERSSPFPCDHFTDVNVEIWTWNPPGYGRSEGKARLENIAATATKFYNYARDSYGKHPVLWLMGNSLGCLSALCVAAETDAGLETGIVLRNPPPLIPVVKKFARKYHLAWTINSVAASLCDPMNAMLTAPRCHSPALFLQSELDTLVPVHLQNEIIKLYGGESHTVVLEGIGHDDKLTVDHQVQVIDKLRWLWSVTRKTR